MSGMVLSMWLGDSRYVQNVAGSLEAEFDLTDSHVLGTGMSGPVRLVVNRREGTTHAVKTLLKEFAVDGVLEDFRQEVELQLSVDHDLVVRLERVIETSTEIYLIMEHLTGGDLMDHVIEQGPLAEAKAADAMCQMLQALAHLHESGIAHRDVKLDNFVFESMAHTRVKLIDFGFATRCGECGLTRDCGSLSTMAPEVIRGNYNVKADLWSLGVVAYMMLCGHSPWSHHEAKTREMIRAGKPNFRPDFFKLSLDAQGFVRFLLTRDPAERPDAKQMLNHSWVALCPKHSVSINVRFAERVEIADVKHSESQSTNDDIRSSSVDSLWGH